MSRPMVDAQVEQVDALPVTADVGALPRELGGKLAGLTLPQQVMALAMWPLLEQVLTFTVGFVDMALAGRISVEATDAIGAATYFIWLINLVQGSVGVGATALIARAMGARHRRLANAALGQAMVLGVGAGLAVGLAVVGLAPWIAQRLNLQGQTAEHFVLYVRIVGAAAPLSALLAVGSAALRGAGDTRTPFLVLVLVNVVNAGVSVTLVQGSKPLGGYGIAGIAIGTFLAWLVGAGAILATLIHGWGQLRLRLIRLRPHAHTMKRIARISLPSLAEMLLSMWVANILVLTIVGQLNQKAYFGANMIAIRAESLSFMPGFAMGMAAMTLTGQYLGLGDPVRARQAVILCWRLAAGAMAVMGLFFIAVPEVFVRLMTNQPEILELSPPLLRMTGFVQVFFGTAIVFRSALQGAGDTRMTMLLMAGSMYLVRLPLAYLLGIVAGLGLRGVWYGLCVELVVRGCIFAGRFFHGGWMKIKV